MTRSYTLFWSVFLMVFLCCWFLPHLFSERIPLETIKAGRLTLFAQAAVVGGLFLGVQPLRRILGVRFEAAKIPISFGFMVLHFLAGLFQIALSYHRDGNLTADFLFPFALFFLLFLGVLLFGIFSILRPISKIS